MKNHILGFVIEFFLIVPYLQNEIKKCGESNFKPSERILGGSYAVKNSWPSIALLIFNYIFSYELNGQFKMEELRAECGAILISADTLLTAAHCFQTKAILSNGYTAPILPNNLYKTYESMYKIYLGVHEKSSIKSEQKYDVISFKIHPFFNRTNLENDIAIIKLSKNVKLSYKIQPACLPFIDEFSSNVWAAGWGITDQIGTYSDILKNVVLKIIKNDYCDLISGNRICAGDIENKKDTCEGDSGGPLYMINNGKQIVIGITSSGKGCSQPGSIGVYTKVFSYLNWINENMSGSLLNKAIVLSNRKNKIYIFLIFITFLNRIIK